MTDAEKIKAIKISTGLYSYRGYTISKNGGYDVNAGVKEYGWNGNATWTVTKNDGGIHIGSSSHKTLKAAKASVDYSVKAVASGAKIINR